MPGKADRSLPSAKELVPSPVDLRRFPELLQADDSEQPGPHKLTGKLHLTRGSNKPLKIFDRERLPARYRGESALKK